MRARAGSWIGLCILGLMSPAMVRAHGALPISQSILWRGDTLLVPVDAWGLFVGSDGGAWRWICEEAINTYSSRQIVLAQDGTIYATDRTGLTVSRDGGCTFSAVQGTIGTLPVVALAATSSRPRVFALAYSSDVTKAGLYTSDDQGVTFQLAYAMPDHLPNGLYVSDDGTTLLLSSLTNVVPRQPVLHVSSDGAMSFTQRVVNHQLDGQPLMAFKPTWSDPRTPDRIYLQAEASNGTALLRIDGAASPVEVLRAPAGITAMALGSGTDQVLVASRQGLYASSGGGPFTKHGMLGAAQCLSAHKGSLYACASNYPPDSAAVARLTNDAQNFTKVFQFSETAGPLDCPAGTPVHQICPSIWQGYADQLGVQLNTSDGGTQPSDMPSSCAVHGVGARKSSTSGMLLFLGTIVAALLHRRKEE